MSIYNAITIAHELKALLSERGRTFVHFDADDSTGRIVIKYRDLTQYITAQQGAALRDEMNAEPDPSKRSKVVREEYFLGARP